MIRYNISYPDLRSQPNRSILHRFWQKIYLPRYIWFCAFWWYIQHTRDLLQSCWLIMGWLWWMRCDVLAPSTSWSGSRHLVMLNDGARKMIFQSPNWHLMICDHWPMKNSLQYIYRAEISPRTDPYLRKIWKSRKVNFLPKSMQFGCDLRSGYDISINGFWENFVFDTGIYIHRLSVL